MGAMALTDARLDEFIVLYEEIYGERLSPEKAGPIAERVVTTYRLITQRPELPELQTEPEAA